MWRVREKGLGLSTLIQQFWKSPFNVVDLILTVFCALTLLVLAFAKCGTGSKEEEILDTLLLIARNVLQFGRLAAVMRQYGSFLPWRFPLLTLNLWLYRSGQSIFSRPKPIDINAARRVGFMDIDIDSDEENDDELSRPLVHNPVLFDAGLDQRPGLGQRQETFTDMPHAAQGLRDRDSEDVWAELG
jgi:hypothetical protein